MTYKPGHIKQYSDPFEDTSGVKAKSAKLTDKRVRHIILSDTPGSILAERYGVHQSRITAIRQKRAWRHVHDQLRREGLS